ncbi:hypothetical protein C882_3880 [Caenispirillum salinarum AK4]|uniref:Probable membrane transporter protein n=1 Tax=Caenispirillum salinarum AK4 TaxID=1238182 RepID=K9H1R4_9PROT|nr:sulfite exporter TauE/SafE family protein [Caenispirillum salinarum]EKV31507.1 hypothetical protein C882_3880 [Caenispirillum salinarum AK4]
MDLLDIAIIAVAAFFGGALNAIAGGGSFLTLPALVFIGVPPVTANATGTVALLPGYMASAWGFRDLLRAPPGGLPLWAVAAVSGIGGAIGAGLLLMTTDAAFSAIVPWLLLAATLLFAFGPKLLETLAKAGREISHGPALTGVAILAVSIYGGYFNGGLGIVLLAVLRLLGEADINVANGVKNLLSALLTIIAVILYAGGGVVAWAEVMPMAVAAVIGGYVAARVSRKVPPQWVRGVVVVTGAVMTVLFFVRG